MILIILLLIENPNFLMIWNLFVKSVYDCLFCLVSTGVQSFSISLISMISQNKKDAEVSPDSDWSWAIEEGEWRQKGAQQKRKLSRPQPLHPPAVKIAMTLSVWWMRMASSDCWRHWKLWELGNIAPMWSGITRGTQDFWWRRSWTRWVISGATGRHLE